MSIKRTIVATAAILASVAMVAPSFAGAVTIEELLAQIAVLQSQLLALQGGTSGTGSTPAACSGVTFTRALVVGSTGADVKCLQASLNAMGHTVASAGVGSPGSETTYFGNLTLAAVRAYQTAKGWTPANQVGPLTRQALNTYLSTGSTGTGTGTGAGTSVGLTGTATIKQVSDLSQYALEDVGEGENNVVVLGKEIEMENTGNARLQQVRVTFDHAGGTEKSGSSTRIEDYAKSVSLMLNGTEVASASGSEFNRDSSGVYSKTFILSSNALLNSGAKNNLTVAVSAVGNLDSGDATEQWDVYIVNIRYVDATGAIITDSSTTNLAGTGNKETFTFVTLATATDLKLKLTVGSDNPVAQAVEVSSTVDTQNITLITFTIKAEGERIWVDTIPVTVTVADASGAGDVSYVTDVVAKIELKLGSSTFSEALPTSGTGTDCDGALGCTVTFNDLDFWLEKNQTISGSVVITAQELTDAATSYSEGDSVLADISAENRAAMVAEDVNGNTIAAGSRSGVVTGEAQALYTTGILVSNFSSSVATRVTGSNTNGVEGDYTVSFKVTAFGNTVYIPRIVSRAAVAGGTAGMGYLVENSAGSSVVPPAITVANGQLSSSATLNSSSLYVVPDGESRTFTGVITLSAPTTNGFHRIQLDKVLYSTTSTDTTPDSSYTPTPANQFESVSANIKTPA